ncbi:hypothetical protein [Fructobacillus fructosus]|uniref:hypothetical protein n=1 Tax=Fructobacillus fructosus TaxID=1631 RepID=UPI002DA27004|nr:hypothetical protein R54866_LGPIEIPA_00033 [Fructobacillus fructosus]
MNKNEKIAKELLGKIEPVWTKEPNTIYELRVALPKFQHEINVFFEWHKAGKSTISRAVKSYESSQQDDVLEAVDILQRNYHLHANVN